MALILCPECKKQVSDAAVSCPHCGYPIESYVKSRREAQEREAVLRRINDAEREKARLYGKVSPCEFLYREPRVKVCVKCGAPFYRNHRVKHDFPTCDCRMSMACVEIDYSTGGRNFIGLSQNNDYAYNPEEKESFVWNGFGDRLYILNQCVIPRNIGDPSSVEYQTYVNSLMACVKREQAILDEISERMGVSGLKVEEVPPDEKYLLSPPPPKPTQKPEHRKLTKEEKQSIAEANNLRYRINGTRRQTSRALFDEITATEKIKTARSRLEYTNRVRLTAAASHNIRQPNALSCPKCGSTTVTTGARGVNWTLGFIGASKTVNRCGNCGHTWKPIG